MVHYLVTCLVSVQVTVLTLAHKSSMAALGKVFQIQCSSSIPVASVLLLCLCTSSKRGIKSSTQFSNGVNNHGACEKLATVLKHLNSSKVVPMVRM